MSCSRKVPSRRNFLSECSTKRERGCWIGSITSVSRSATPCCPNCHELAIRDLSPFMAMSSGAIQGAFFPAFASIQVRRGNSPSKSNRSLIFCSPRGDAMWRLPEPPSRHSERPVWPEKTVSKFWSLNDMDLTRLSQKKRLVQYRQHHREPRTCRPQTAARTR